VRTTVLALLCWLAAAGPAAALDVREGDIVFHTSRSAQSLAIQRATGSPYSHMGLVLFRDGKPFVFEAVATVRHTPLAAWIRRGDKGRYVVKRLADADTILTPEALERLRAAARSFAGKPYDLTFEWSDTRIYCSELVWKIYRQALGIELGALQRLGAFKLDDRAVRLKLEERYRGAVPLGEPVISPGEMFASPRLSTVGKDRP
jgi:hypothetical protein